MKIEFLYEARLDMIQAHNWYETKNKNLGKVFELSIEKSLNENSLLPKASPIWYKSIRRYVVDKFPYGLFYLVKNEIIIIVAVFAFKQNPKYLVDRINNNI